MKVVILDGDRAPDGAAARAVEALAAALTARGDEVVRWSLREVALAHCQGCFECWTKTPGRCRARDEGNEVAASVIGSHAMVWATPVTFGGYSSTLKKIVDRLICLILPFFTTVEGETHHAARYEHYPLLLVLGSVAAPDPDQVGLFARLVERNALNMHAPLHRAVTFTAAEVDEAAADGERWLREAREVAR
jgi:multimeric flavodoxin WrbA